MVNPGDTRLGRWLRDGGKRSLDFALGGAVDVVGLVDRDLVIRYVNWTAAPGLTREAVVGCTALELVPPDYREVARRHYEQVLADGRGARFEVIFEGEHGILVFEVRVGPVFDGEEVIGLVTFNTDITEQRRASADRDRFFSLSLDMLVVVDPDGRFKRVNPAFGKALGLAPESLIGRSFGEFVHRDDLESSKQVFARVLEGTPVVDFENRYRRSDGQARVFSWRATADPITGDIYAVARDLTEHRETEMRLRHAQKMEAVGQLAGGVAHDFNNLIQVVLANTQLALESARRDPEEVAHLNSIEEAADRAADLTRGLLAFSRRQPLRPVPLDLNDLVRGLLEMLRRLLPENIRTAFVPGRGLSSVSVDRTQLEQVVVNLAINARDAMERGGNLTLETDNVLLDQEFCDSHAWARPGSWVVLRVSDTGTGMEPEVRDRIFDPFFTTKGPQQGTGLGLATAYGIVRQHGGMIDVHSQLGEGTRFTIFLPVDDRPAAAAAGPSHDEDLPRGQETILVAEDEASVRSAVIAMLQTGGYQVISAENGIAAVERLRTHEGAVHLALLDVIMPELDGPETWQQLRALRPDLRVLFVSGYADDQHRARLPPQAELLPKPFRMGELLAQVRKVLDA